MNHFESWRPGFAWLMWLCTGLAVVSVGVWGFFVFSDPEVPRGLVPWLINAVVLMGIFPFFTWVFGTYHVRSDASSITFGYTGWKVTIPRAEVAELSIIDITWWKWGGMGWRLKGLNHIGYIAKSGTGIRLLTQQGRIYEFNCEDPTAVLGAFTPPP